MKSYFNANPQVNERSFLCNLISYSVSKCQNKVSIHCLHILQPRLNYRNFVRYIVQKGCPNKHESLETT